MASFPSIAPIHSLNKTIAPDRSRTKFGDGHLGTHGFSLNTNKPEWQLEWLVDLADASTIDTFLRARANSASFFEWTPPDSAGLGAWRCDEWTVEQVGPEVYKISAAFKRVYELSVYQLIAEAATCPPQALCGADEVEIICSNCIDNIPIYNTPLSLTELPQVPGGCSVQWTRDGVPIPGATSTTYTIGFFDIGYTIGVTYTCGIAPAATTATITLDNKVPVPSLYWPTAICGNAFLAWGYVDSWTSCWTGATGGFTQNPLAPAPSNYVCGNYFGTRTNNYCGVGPASLSGAMKYSAGCNTPRCWPRNGNFVAGTSPTTASQVQGLWGSNTGNPIDRSSKSFHATIITAFVLQGNVPGLGVYGENVYDKLIASSIETFGPENAGESEGF